MSIRPETYALLERACSDYEPFERVLALATDQGVGIAELLAEVEFDDDWADEPTPGALLVRNHNDWISEVVRHLGGDLELAQAAVIASGKYANVDVAEHTRIVLLQRRLSEALRNNVPLSEILDIVSAAPGRLDYAVDSFMNSRTLPELVAAWDKLPADRLRVTLLRRFAKDVVVEAAFAAMTDPDATKWLTTCYGLRNPFDEADPRAAVHLRLEAQVLAGRSLWEVVPFANARLVPSEWLPMFAERGFSPSFIALAALERGLSVADIAQLMVNSGVSSVEVLGALEECGAGPRSALRLLHEASWTLSELVAMARAAGHMDSEIRELLRSIRVGDDAIRQILSTAMTSEG